MQQTQLGTDFILNALALEEIDHLFLVPGGLIDPFLPALEQQRFAKPDPYGIGLRLAWQIHCQPCVPFFHTLKRGAGLVGKRVLSIVSCTAIK
jgi:hypothetical protein